MDEDKDQNENENINNEENNEFEFGQKKEADPGKNKLIVAQQIIRNIQSNLEQLSSLLGAEAGSASGNLLTEVKMPEVSNEEGRVIEGVFDGQNMIGPDGKQYTVPTNYASKSKLVEGDILKLSINRSGGFIYKQIGPIERSRIIGTLAMDEETREYYVVSENKSYKVLAASITYFKGEPGDEVVILVPKSSDSSWAAVENVIKKIAQ